MPRARASHQPGTGCCYRRGKARIRRRSSGHEVTLMIIPEFYCRLFVARAGSQKGLDLRTQGFWVSALSFLRAVSARRGEPPEEPPDSTIWARRRGRPVPPPSRPGKQFRARRYWHEYRANHRNSPSAFGGRAHRMAQAAHGLFRPMVVAWQKRPGCVRIAVAAGRRVTVSMAWSIAAVRSLMSRAACPRQLGSIPGARRAGNCRP